MSAIMGHHLGKELIAALGLPLRTRKFVLTAETNSVVTIECEYYADGDGVKTALTLATKKYELTERK